MYNPIVWLIIQVLDIYWWIVIVAVIASWLVVFNVVNGHNPLVRQILRALDAVTEPVFRQVRRVIPPLGGMDVSPLVVILAIAFIEYALEWATLRGYL